MAFTGKGDGKPLKNPTKRADLEKGRWVTIRGAKVFIHEGENVNQAFSRFKKGNLSKSEKAVENSKKRNEEKRDKQKYGDFNKRKQDRIEDQEFDRATSMYARGEMNSRELREEARRLNYAVGSKKLREVYRRRRG